MSPSSVRVRLGLLIAVLAAAVAASHSGTHSVAEHGPLQASLVVGEEIDPHTLDLVLLEAGCLAVLAAGLVGQRPTRSRSLPALEPKTRAVSDSSPTPTPRWGSRLPVLCVLRI